MIIVSACLIGRPCRYDGRRAPNLDLMTRLAGRRWVAVCPEQLGGLPTPRVPARLEGGNGRDVLAGRARVINDEGRDVTAAFIRGAEVVLDLAVRLGAEVCCLKNRSPSCGLCPSLGPEEPFQGPGVCAALLADAGLKIEEVKAPSSD